MLKKTTAVFCFLSFCNSIIAQSLHSDTSQNAATASAIAFYNNTISRQSGLYNGRQYFNYPSQYIGFAYFGINGFQNGSLQYDGDTYRDVPMKYDLVNDQLVIKYFDGTTEISLVKEKLNRFEIGGNSFIKIEKDSADKAQIPDGFYEQLFDGNTAVLAKKIKITKDYTVGQKIETHFDEKNTYYLKKDTNYYMIRNKNSILEVFKDRKKEMQQYLRKNKLKYKKDPETTLVKAAAYYDSLKK